jgi:hypothetical protein
MSDFEVELGIIAILSIIIIAPTFYNVVRYLFDNKE